MAWSYRLDQADQVYSDTLGPAVVDGQRTTDTPSPPFPNVGGGGGSGTGDFVGPASAVVNQVMLFADTTGKLGKAATQTGLAKLTAGVLSAATAGTDYENPLTFGATVTRSTNAISLVNDSGSPGNSMLYGTNSSGVKGWYAQPTGGGGSITGGGLVTGNVTVGGATATSVADGAVALASLALAANIPTDLNQLNVSDASIVRKKITYVSAGSVAASGAISLVPGSIYYGTITGAVTFSFSVAPQESDPPTRLYLNFSSPPTTVTYPAAIRNADNGASTSAIVQMTQYAVIEFFKTGAGNVRMLDNILPSDAFGTIVATFDGVGTALTTTNTLVPYTVPYNATIIGWNVSVDAGTATFQVWKKADGSSIPTSGDSITTGTTLAIASGTHVRSTLLTAFGANTAVLAGDMFVVQLSAVATATKAVFEIELRKG